MNRYIKINFFLFVALLCSSVQLTHCMSHRLRRLVAPSALVGIAGLSSTRSFATQDVSGLTPEERRALAEENKKAFLFKPEGEKHYGEGLYLQGVDLRPRNKEPWYNIGHLIAKPIEALFGMNITKEDLGSAQLSDADLSHALLQGAFLSYAEFERAILIQTNLEEAKLDSARFNGAVLRQANLQRAFLVEANLTKADLTDADLRGANLSKTILTGAKLYDADLGGARFFKTDLSGALFTPDQLTPDIYLCKSRVAGNALRDKTHAIDNEDGTWTSYRGCSDSSIYPHSKAAQYEREEARKKAEFKRINEAYQRKNAGGDPTEWNLHQQKLDAEHAAARAQREAEIRKEQEERDKDPRVQAYWARRKPRDKADADKEWLKEIDAKLRHKVAFEESLTAIEEEIKRNKKN